MGEGQRPGGLLPSTDQRGSDHQVDGCGFAGENGTELRLRVLARSDKLVQELINYLGLELILLC